MSRRYSFPLPPFVGIEKLDDCDGSSRAVLRIRRGQVAWQCEHEHHDRQAALTCALQARAQALAATLLPEVSPRAWAE